MDEAAPARGSGRREHVIPTGRMHLVFRLSDDPLRLFEHDEDREGHVVSTMVVGGARARYYIRDVSKPLCSVGALLRPGAAEVLFGVHAHELSDRHTALEDLWGADATSMRDQLGDARSCEGRLDAFERLLAQRLPVVRGLHPAVARALERLGSPTAVHDDRQAERIQPSPVHHAVLARRRADAEDVCPCDALSRGASSYRCTWVARAVGRRRQRGRLQRPVAFPSRIPGVHGRHARRVPADLAACSASRAGRPP